MIKELALDQQGDSYRVTEENWEIVLMFLRLATQWTYTYGSVVGINYQSLDFLMKSFRTKNKVEMIEGIQTMEVAAIKVMRSKESK